ncbi:hypothetical protein BV898_15408 [Hypsibius exemplaris]|uniref:Flavoprotein domain-containing protein n=1 Tax=Hypsibius exemplaris TaxID=2072580 RepID=A0A9X6NAY0_HYPEX|nr:hypothetical protein BV898_15408 [Hypsibius exemplaris]
MAERPSNDEKVPLPENRTRIRSGSVACIKVPEILDLLHAAFPTYEIILTPTKHACYFLPKSTAGHLDLNLSPTGDAENCLFSAVNTFDEASVEAVRRRVKAEDVAAVVIAPIGANLMAQLANPDQFLYKNSTDPVHTLLQELFEYNKLKTSRPKALVIAPAMNQSMWNSTLTDRNLSQLRKLYGPDLHIIPTVCKASMCGEVGFGCMAYPRSIVQQLEYILLHGSLIPNTEPDIIDIPTRLFAGVPSTSSQQPLVLNFRPSDSTAPLLYQGCLTRIENVTTAVGNPARDNFKTSVKVAVREATEGLGRQSLLDTEVFTDREEWTMWTKRTDPILHIVLRQWADILLLVDPSPDFVRTIVFGACDDLLSCIVRAWDFRHALFVVFTDSKRALFPIDLLAELQSACIPVIQTTTI